MGASGYTGGELLRMLLNHPYVEIQQIIGNESAGKNISNIFSNFIDTNLPKIKSYKSYLNKMESLKIKREIFKFEDNNIYILESEAEKFGYLKKSLFP